MTLRNRMKTPLQATIKNGIMRLQSQKTIASRRKLNDKSTANSTPKACFFIRSTRTPKENNERKNALVNLLSMVACYGQPVVVGCVPLIAVSYPVTRYRQAVGSTAVTLTQFINGVTQMLFTFLCVDRTHPDYTEVKIKVSAPNEHEARWLLPADYRLLLDHPIAQIAENRLNPTACSATEVSYAS